MVTLFQLSYYSTLTGRMPPVNRAARWFRQADTGSVASTEEDVNMFSLIIGIDAVQRAMAETFELGGSSHQRHAPAERRDRRPARALWASLASVGAMGRVLRRRGETTSRPCEETAVP
jgi:hypothetical protein